MDAAKVKEVILNILRSRMNDRKHHATFQSEKIILEIIKAAKENFKKENSLLRLHGKFVVVGDIHGNIDDLLRIFEKCGYPPESNYLFLGDYVDRGNNSSEVIVLLLCLKVLYPNSIYLIRGNHECQAITSMYGFRNECEQVFNNKVYNKFMKCFMYLSYAAIINDSYFCVHGGISPFLKSLDDIECLEKPKLSSESQIASDLVWSDPNESVKTFQNSPRGSGYFFGDKKLNQFLEQNRLKKLIRSHEACTDGIDYPLENCITIFSNTDYCEMNNDAAVIIIKQDLDDISSSPSEDSDEISAFIISTDYQQNTNDDFEIEYFSPLSAIEIKQRRILIPEWILETETGKDIIQDDLCAIPPHELFDQIINNQTICVF